MNRREAIIAGVAGVAAAVAVAPSADAQASQGTDSDSDQIRALLKAHDEAFTNQDLNGVLACFTLGLFIASVAEIRPGPYRAARLLVNKSARYGCSRWVVPAKRLALALLLVAPPMFTGSASYSRPDIVSPSPSAAVPVRPVYPADRSLELCRRLCPPDQPGPLRAVRSEVLCLPIGCT